jgi:hypothetical protein
MLAPMKEFYAYAAGKIKTCDDIRRLSKVASPGPTQRKWR